MNNASYPAPTNRKITPHPLISAVTVFYIILGLFVAMRDNSAIADTSKDWAFYGSFVQEVSQVDYAVKSDNFDFYGNVSNPDPEISAIFTEVKSRLHLELDSYDYLFWDRFDQADLKACDITDFTPSGLSTMAFYQRQDNTVYYVSNQFQALLDTNNLIRIREIIAHELVHALTTSSANEQSLICEGFTEYIAYKIYPTGYPAYDYHYAFIDTLVKDIGIENGIEAFFNGTVEQIIDQRIGQTDAIHNIAPALQRTAIGTSTDDDELIIIDVYAHYLKATGIQDNYTRDAFNAMLIRLKSTPRNIVACEYFKEMLPFISTATESQSRFFLHHKKTPAFRLTSFLIRNTN